MRGYKEQKRADKPIVDVWHRQLELEIKQKTVHWGCNGETLCNKPGANTMDLASVTCEKCRETLGWILKKDCLKDGNYANR